MKTVYIVVGRYWLADPDKMSAHRSLAGAKLRANELANEILSDQNIPTIPRDASDEARDDALELIRQRSKNGGTDCDIDILIVPVED